MVVVEIYTNDQALRLARNATGLIRRRKVIHIKKLPIQINNIMYFNLILIGGILMGAVHQECLNVANC